MLIILSGVALVGWVALLRTRHRAEIQGGSGSIEQATAALAQRRRRRIGSGHAH